MNLANNLSAWLIRMSHRQTWPLWLWGVAFLSLLLIDWFPLRAASALLLLFLLPGWAWLEAGSPWPQEGLWRLILAVALSLILSSLGILYLIYLPGPLTLTQLLIFCAVITVPALLIAQRRKMPPLIWSPTNHWLLYLIVLCVALLVRLPNLGYAEFHEDEVEVTSLAARAIQGTDYAVFLHRKGPLQMLVPSGGWLLAQRISEGWARLPFALASILGTLAITRFALRLAGSPAALTAGLLLALNGYLVVFGRMVQYQALIFFLASVGLIILYQAAQNGKQFPLWLGANALAVSLLAHYDAMLYLPVAAYLAWLIWRQQPTLRRPLSAAAAVSLLILLSFYLPYVLDPQFSQTRSYLIESRVGTSLLYNNLNTLENLDGDYASRFYLPVLGLLSLAALLAVSPAKRFWWVIISGLLLAMWTTWQWDEIWRWGVLDASFLPWLLLIGLLGIRLHRQHPGQAFVLLWWGIPFLAYTFLVEDPRTHLYVAYPGWAVISGLGMAYAWQKMGRWRWLVPALGSAAAMLVIGYMTIVYLSSESSLTKRQENWSGSLAQRIYRDLPEPRERFGYPKRVGWKAAGILMDNGLLPNDYRSAGEDFSVPIWYSFETPRSCFDDPALYLVAQSFESLGADLQQRLGGYAHQGSIIVEGQARIEFYRKGASAAAPVQYNLTDLEAQFDAKATPAHFANRNQPAQAMVAQFGEVARLTGFTLSATQVKPGTDLFVYLHWEGLAETDIRYRTFVHFGQDPVWTQHDDDPACRLPITLWRRGQEAVGHFRLTLPPDILPGSYPILIGLYHPDTFERLPVLDYLDQPLGDSLTIGTVEVVGE